MKGCDSVGIFDDMMSDVFGSSAKPQEPTARSSGGLMDTLFGGFSTTGHVSGGSSGGSSWIDTMFDGYRVDPPAPRQQSGGLFGSSRPEVGLGGYQEPILPAASQAVGYGGQRFSSQAQADISQCISGQVCDPDTNYCGTVAEIYAAYLREGRDPKRLVERFKKRR